MKRCFSTGKKCYTKERAEEVRDYEQARSLNKLRVYLCEFCNEYHLTHHKAYRF